MLDDSFKNRYTSVQMAISITQDKQSNTSPHNHREFEILSITTGHSNIIINNKTYPAKAGDLFFINPLEIHAVDVISAKPYAHRCISFDCSMIMNPEIVTELLSEVLKIGHHIPAESLHASPLEAYFSKTLYAYQQNDRFTVMEVTAQLSLMFAYLLKNELFAAPAPSTKSTAFCRSVLEFISRHYTEDITSQEVSAALCYNQSYFCRNFKKNFGKSFSEYLQFYRVSEARKLLEKKEKSITEIASDCGFNTPSYFTKCFRKYFGVLPSFYHSKSILF